MAPKAAMLFPTIAKTVATLTVDEHVWAGLVVWSRGPTPVTSANVAKSVCCWHRNLQVSKLALGNRHASDAGCVLQEQQSSLVRVVDRDSCLEIGCAQRR